jgi:signal transduction histidine kinase
VAEHLFDQYDEERKQLARQLHGAAAQQLAALQLDLSLIESAAGTLPERAAQALAQCSELAQACAREIRAVSNRLHPPLLEEAGLPAALRALAAEFGCKLAADFPEEMEAIPSQIALGAFRIVEELVLCSEPREDASIALACQSESLVVVIAGTGEPRSASAHERINGLGGSKSLFISGAYWRLSVTLPLTAAES